MSLIHTSKGVIDAPSSGLGGDLFVLLHASATGPKSLAGLVRALARPGRQIITPALNGYGGTRLDGRGAGNRMVVNRAIAQTVLATPEADSGQLPERRVIFGHSMGGLVALLAAMAGEAEGQPCDALVLYEPILMDLSRDADVTGEAASAFAWDRQVRTRLIREVKAGNAEAGVRQFIEAWNETAWEDLPETGRQQILAGAETLAADVEALSGGLFDPSALARIHTPTLILRGSGSPASTVHIAARAVSLMPNARDAVLADCGHMAPLLSPVAVAQAMETFLEAVSSRRGGCDA